MRLLFLLCAALLFICGCETLDDNVDLSWEEIMADKPKPSYEPKYTLSFNRIIKYPRGSNLELALPTATGKQIWVNKNYFLSTHNIEQVQVVKSRERPGMCDLKLKLDRLGRLKWMQISVYFKTEKIALLVDGIYYRSLYPGAITTENDEWVLLRGPFDSETAGQIAKYSKQNYKFYLPENKKPIFGD